MEEVDAGDLSTHTSVVTVTTIKNIAEADATVTSSAGLSFDFCVAALGAETVAVVLALCECLGDCAIDGTRNSVGICMSGKFDMVGVTELGSGNEKSIPGNPFKLSLSSRTMGSSKSGSTIAFGTGI